MARIVNALTCPLAPALLDVDLINLALKVVLNFTFFLHFKIVSCLVSISHEQRADYFFLVRSRLSRLNKLGCLSVEVSQVILAERNCGLFQALFHCRLVLLL